MHKHPETHTPMLTAGHATMLAETAIQAYTNSLIFAGAHLPDGYANIERERITWVAGAITETARMNHRHD